MGSSCLVTGGAGFIGSSIARALLERGDRVRVIDNFSSGKRANLTEISADIDLHEADIRDDAALDRALAGVEFVFHHAAIPSVPRSLIEPLANHETNATATLKLLIGAKKAGVRRVMYAASSATYGDAPVLPKVETMAPAPMSPYAVSKLSGEYYCQIFATAYNLETVCLRYFNVFGPRQDPTSEYSAVIPLFITAALAKRGVTIFGDGSQSRDFCYIDNVVQANLLASTASGVSGQSLNIACGSSVDLNQVVHFLGEICGWPVPINYAPRRVGDVLHSVADISLATQWLKYAPTVTFPEGLRRTLDWFRAH
jgi:nucleoside-diphosphate-sugar epimerase